MQLSQIFPKLRARWSTNWKSRQLSRRMRDLSIQFIGYSFITLFLLMTASILILYLLPIGLQQGGIQFLTLIYLCCLGIITSRSFDQNHIQFQLDLIMADVDRIALNTGSLEIEALRQAVDNLNNQMGPP